MNKGITSSGFAYELNDTILNDWEFLELLVEIEDNPQKVVLAARYLLGNEQLKHLKNHVRSENNVVRADLMINEIFEIFNTNNQTKN